MVLFLLILWMTTGSERSDSARVMQPAGLGGFWEPHCFTALGIWAAENRLLASKEGGLSPHMTAHKAP